jgi:hypothetical protein
LVWKGKKRWTLIVAWFLLLAIVWVIGTHPALMMPYLSKLASNHFLRGSGSNLTVQNWSGSLLGDLQLHGVNLELQLENDASVYMTVDTLSLQYGFLDLVKQPVRFSGVHANGVDLFASRGTQVVSSNQTLRVNPFRMPKMSIGHATVENMNISLSDHDGKIIQSIPELNWTGSVVVDNDIEVKSIDSDIYLESQNTELDHLSGIVKYSDSAISFIGLTVDADSTSYEIDGHRMHSGELDLSIIGHRVVIQDVEELLDMSLGFEASGDVDLAITGRLDSLVLDVNYDGVLEDYRLKKMHGLCLFKDNILSWSEISTEINGAEFNGDGFFDVSNNDVYFELQGSASNINLAEGFVPGVVLPQSNAAGSISIKRSDSNNETIITASVKDGHISILPFEECRVLVVANSTGVDIQQLDVQYKDLNLIFSGVVDTTGYFDGSLNAKSSNLASLPQEWGVPVSEGSAILSGKVSGTDPVFDFDGQATLSEISLPPLSVNSGDWEIVVKDLLGDWGVSANAKGGGLNLRGLDLGNYRFEGVAGADYARVHSFHSTLGDTTISARGQATYQDSLSSYYIPEFTINVEGSSWQLENPVMLEFSPETVAVDSFAIASEFGALRCAGTIDRSSDLLDGSLFLTGFDMSMLSPLAGEKGKHLSGELSAELLCGGTASNPVFDLQATLVGSEFPLAVIDSLTVSSIYDNGNLEVNNLELYSNHGDAKLNGLVKSEAGKLTEFWDKAVLDLDVYINNGNWSFLDQFQIPALDRIAGVFNGSINVSGDTEFPVFDGQLESGPFDIHWVHLDQLQSRISYSDDQLVLAKLAGNKDDLSLTGRIELPLHLDFKSVPVEIKDGPLYMSFDLPSKSNLEPLSRATNGFVKSSGRGVANLVIAGPASHPEWTGTVSVQNGHCVMVNQQEVYRGLDIYGVWSGDILKVDLLAGREGERGTITGGGKVRFDGLSLSGFDLGFNVDRFLIATIPEVQAIGKSDNIHLLGVKVGPDSLLVPKFVGDLEIIKGRYVGDFTETPGAVDPTIGTVAPDWLADINIHAPNRTVHIKNKAMELTLGGDVRLVQDIEGLYLRGNMGIDHGRLMAFNNEFKITDGSLDFSREVGIFPLIDIVAETSIRLPSQDGGSRRLEKVYVDVAGTALEPVISFRSDSGYARTNIERMLLGLSPHATDTEMLAGLQTVSMSAGFNLLEREIATELDVIDTFDIISNQNRLDGTTQTLIGVGKYIGRDLYVKVAQALTDTDREMLMEYQITDHLLLQSEMSQRQDEALGATTFSIDVKYRIEY